MKARQNVRVRYQDREGRGRDKNCSGKIDFFGGNTFPPSIRIAVVIMVRVRKTNMVCQEEK